MPKWRNITLRMPEDLIKRAKVVAVREDTSLSALLTRYLADGVAKADGYEAARDRALERMTQGFDFGTTTENYPWSRDDLHERA